MCLRWILCSIFCLPSLFYRAAAQSPTLGETTQFLADRVDGKQFSYEYRQSLFSGSSHPPIEIVHRIKVSESLSFTGCEGHVVITSLHSESKDGGDWVVDDNADTIVDRHFQGVNLRVNSGFVEAYSDKAKEILQVGLPGSPTGAVFLTDDRSLATRLEKALIGYAKLCGAKDEPY